MRIIDKREAHNQEVKRRILDAARELLLADGVEGFSMRKLGNRIGYTPTGIYHHFADKQVLLQSLIIADMRVFRSALGVIGEVTDPIDRILRMADAYLMFASEQPNHYRMLFMLPQLQPPDAENEAIQHGDPAEDSYAFLKQAVVQSMDQKRFRPEFTDPDELTQILWAGVHGLVSLHIAKCNDLDWITWKPLKPTFRKMVEALMRGLVAAPS